MATFTGTGKANILEACNNKYWKSPEGKTGKNAEIVIDLKCLTMLDSFSVVNGFGDFGTKQFSLHGSESIDGPWTDLYEGELIKGIEMNEEVSEDILGIIFILKILLSVSQ